MASDVKFSNIIMLTLCHSRKDNFSKQKHRLNNQSGPQFFPYNVIAHFKYFQVLTHVQTPFESPDLTWILFI